MNFTSFPYGVTHPTNGPTTGGVRRWTRVMQAKLRRIFEYWGASRIDAHFPPC